MIHYHLFAVRSWGLVSKSNVNVDKYKLQNTKILGKCKMKSVQILKNTKLRMLNVLIRMSDM